MALKFRRGTTAQKSGSLAFGEPFVNTDLNTLQIGGPSGDITLGTTGESSAFAGVSVSASSFISGSGLKITGNAVIDGNLTLGGAITIGDATADTVNVVASLSSSLIPSNDNTFDVGRNDKRYRAIYSNTLSASVLEIESGSWAEVRLKNSSTGIDYHVQNTAGGNFSIHNAEYNASIFRIDSGSFPQHAHFFGDLNVSQSLYVGLEVSAATGSFGVLRAINTISGSIAGIGNVSSYSSSVNSRLVVVEGVSASAASALNNVSGAFATTVSSLGGNYATDAELSAVSSAVATTIGNLGNTYATDSELSAVSSAVAARDAAQDVLISSLQSNIVSASVFNTFSTSVDSRILTEKGRVDAILSASTADADTFAEIVTLINSVDTTSDTVFGGFVTSSNATNNTQNARLSALETETGSIATAQSAQNARLTSLETTSGSHNSRLSDLEGFSSSLNSTFTTDAELSSVSGAFATTISNLGSTYATDAELSAVSSAVAVRDAGQDTTISTLSSSVNSRLVVVEGVSASAASALNSLSSSASSAYAKLNSTNTFNGTQTISGSLIVTQDLVIGGSASIQHVTSSQLNISDNIITVNTINPTVRFGGLAVIDSGSGQSGSFLYDSVQDEFVFVHKGDGTNITSSHFLVGPETYNNLGNETYLSANKVIKSNGNEHVVESNITDNGTTITLGSNTSVTGTLVATGTSLVSASAQITLSSTTGYSTFSSSVAATDAAQDTTISTLSSSVNSRLVTLEGKDITITLTGEVTGTGTITDLGNVSFATTIAANSVALGTDTTGNYVASLVEGTGVTITNNSGEGATPTIAIGQAVATSDNVRFNSLGIGMAASATAGRIDATNDIVAFSSSDIRFKENIKPIENAIDKIRKISGNTYDWKEENKIEHGYEGNDVGVIAQEIEAVLPQLVQTRESGYKAVKYDKLVALLIEGIKEQQLQIEQLRIDLDNCRNKGL
jgi:hypothetical protein